MCHFDRKSEDAAKLSDVGSTMAVPRREADSDIQTPEGAEIDKYKIKVCLHLREGGLHLPEHATQGTVGERARATFGNCFASAPDQGAGLITYKRPTEEEGSPPPS